MKRFILGLFIVLGSIIILSAQNADAPKYKSLMSYQKFIEGVYHYNTRSYNAAIDAFIKALEHKPDDFRARIWLGKAYYHAGYEKNAISEWERVINQGGGTNLLRQKLNFIFYQRSLEKRYKMHRSYIPLKTIKGVQEKNYTFVHATSIAMRNPKELFVSGFSSANICLFDQNGLIKTRIDKGDKNFKKPFDMAIDKNGNLYVTDFGADSVHIYNRRNEHITSFGGFGLKQGEFSGPEGIFVDKKNNIYVVDSGNNRVQQFRINRDNAVIFLREFGKRGAGPGQFFRPTDVCVSDDGKIFVTDMGNKRVQVFDDSGNYLKQFGNDYLKRPRGMLLIDKNNLLIADEQIGIIKYNILESSWHVIKKKDNEELFNPVDMLLDQHGLLYIADYGRKNLLVLIPEKLKYVNLNVDILQTFNKNYPKLTHKVRVTDRFNNDIKGLDYTNFVIYDNNKRVKEYSVHEFKPGADRMRIIILNDRSVNMKKYNSELRELMNEFLRKLKSADRVKVINFGKGYEDAIPFMNQRLKPLEMITSDNYSIEQQAGKAMYESINKSFSNNAKPRILLITNGKLSGDAFQPYGLEGLINYAKNNNVPVFVLCFGTGERLHDLKLIAEKTGGRFISASSSNDVYRLVKLMRDKEDIFYLINYTTISASEFARKAWRTLRVELNYKKLFGLDRGGYFIP